MKYFVKPIVFVLFSVASTAQTIPEKIIWSENFDSVRWASSIVPFNPSTYYGNIMINPGLMPNGWTAEDAYNEEYYWHWSQLGPRGRYTSFDGIDGGTSFIPTNDPKKILQSSTKENGFMMLESDYFNMSMVPEFIPVPMNSFFMSPPIDLSATGTVFLKFEQTFRICCNETAKISVFVSNDFNTLGNSAHWTEYDASLNTPVISFSKNPSIALFDISEVAAGHDSVYLKWKQYGASHFYWEIDDVELIEPFNFNVALDDVFDDYVFDPPTEGFNGRYSGGYRFIPRNQIGNFSGVRVVGRNEGAMPVSAHARLKILKNEIESQISGNSNTLTIPRCILDTFKIYGPFAIPPKIGKYTFRVEAVTDSLDSFPDNNTREIDFYITDTLYSRSSEEKENMIPFGNNPLLIPTLTRGKYYYFPNQSVVKAIRFFFSPSNNINNVQNGYLKCRGHIYAGDSANIAQNIPLFSTSTFTLSPSDIGNFINIPFDNNSLPFLQAGDYYFALEGIDNNPQHDNEDEKEFWIGQDVTMGQYTHDHGWPVSALFYGSWYKINENIAISVIVESELTELSQVQLTADITQLISQNLFDPLTDSLCLLASFNGFGEDALVLTPDGSNTYSCLAQIPEGDLIQFKLKTSNGIEEDEYRFCNITRDTTIMVYWNAPLHVQKPARKDEFEIFPNPVSDLLSLSTNLKIQSVKVFNAAGKLVMQAGKDSYNLQVSELPTGIYMVEVLGENSVYRAKFVKK